MLAGRHVKLIDLGNCYDIDLPKTHLISTRGYRAPEVEEGHWDEKVDLFSVGRVLLELISCK
jgi:serine/threonine protein kinase